MNQHDQMLREALRNNMRAFINSATGEVRYMLFDNHIESEWEEVMIIPNLPNEVIDSVLAAEPAPLARLTDEKIKKIWRERVHFSLHRDSDEIAAVINFVDITNAIMDAMGAANK